MQPQSFEPGPAPVPLKSASTDPRMVGGSFDYDVYVSYSHLDHALVAPLVHQWMQQFDLKVFFDAYSIGAGQDFTQKMQTALNRSRACVYFITPNSCQSPWVRWETNHPLLIPVKLLEPPPGGVVGVAATLSWIDLTDAGTLLREYGRLLAKITEHLRTPAPDRLRDSMGIVDVFLSEDEDQENLRRNEAKKKALQQAVERNAHVKLLAETGHSYLAQPTNRFYKEVRAILDKAGRFSVILANPNFIAGYLISLASRRKAPVNSPLAHEDDEYQNKFRSAVIGYKRLKVEFPERIEMRIAPCVIQSTILLTKRFAFFEPYLFQDRYRKSEVFLDTFELQIDRKNCGDFDIFSLDEHFDFLWEVSTPYEQWVERKEDFRALLAESLKLLAK